ncbi:MAG: TIR domain-containing protein [Anaerolineae bacterium]|nr:TIR domain-containing protein [Anaerolineae bacterium]
MASPEKTVFISYRRTNAFTALAVYQDLTQHGYDVFFDYNSIDSGDFEQVILNNILSRTHFIVILTPSALERCNEPGDWLRREIETALDSKRNIVPLMFEGFSFGDASIDKHLTGKLALLKQYNAQRVPADFFEEAMERIRSRHLNTTLDAVLHPRTPAAQQAANRAQSNASAQPRVQEGILTAHEWFEKAYKAHQHDHDLEAAYNAYSQAIAQNSEYAMAYNNRAWVLLDMVDRLDEVIADCNRALRIDPQLHYAYNNRGLAHYRLKNYASSIADTTEAIRLKSDYIDAMLTRGAGYYMQGNKQLARADWETALRYDPNNQIARDNLKLVE